eukprot:768693-Hanusia_phi.AAC.8
MSLSQKKLAAGPDCPATSISSSHECGNGWKTEGKRKIARDRDRAGDRRESGIGEGKERRLIFWTDSFVAQPVAASLSRVDADT